MEKQNPTSLQPVHATVQTITIPCPCCGQKIADAAAVCRSCGAERVAEPLAKPDNILPGQGASFAALAIPLLVITSFLVIWLFTNDMKVIRVAMVSLFGESLKSTRELLQLDPKLPFYRIFSFDAYRLSFYLSAVLLPLSLAGIWMARRARRLIQHNPAKFGGLRVANVSLTLSVLLTVVLSASVISSIPRLIETRQARQIAATRAGFYELQRHLLQYREKYGYYPTELSDLQKLPGVSLNQTDYWEKQIIYVPNAVVASTESASGFSNYQLVSAGPDGIVGNTDDIVLQDGVIVSSSAERELPMPLPEK
jgi:hypothetical protein